jgi:hypothetical protein
LYISAISGLYELGLFAVVADESKKTDLFFFGTCEQRVIFFVNPFREDQTSVDFDSVNSFSVSYLFFCRVLRCISPIAFCFLPSLTEENQISAVLFEFVPLIGFYT